jgi:hypothetical protein
VSDADRRPYSDGFDEDAIFADIVAHLNDDPGTEEHEPLPVGEDLATPLSQDVPTDVSETVPTEAEAPADPAPQAWRGRDVEDEVEEHFEPPPVTPLPAGDLSFWAIILGMGGGPLLLLYLVFFNPDAGSYWVLTAIAMSVGGFALLVSRMPGHQEDDDDGARL